MVTGHGRTHSQTYPVTHDRSKVPHTPAEAEFIRRQRDMEIGLGRFSESFGTDLLPGMYSMPVHAVPKPRSVDLRLVTDQSNGDYSLNSMINRSDIAGVRLDSIHDLGASLLEYHRHHPDTKLVMFKSDVSQAYRRLPMHPLWQVKQINMVDGFRHVDRCNAFGNRAALRIFASFMACVMWIASHLRLIDDLKTYVDDVFSFELLGNTLWYPPYNKHLPYKQAKLLMLWDDIGLPHDERKQLSDNSLTVIGLEVDPNAMTVSMSLESRTELVEAIQSFLTYPRSGKRRRTLREFQQLAGWVNWALNVYPLLKPSLCGIYEKIAGKTRFDASLYVGIGIERELFWLRKHVQSSDGVYFFKSVIWHNPDVIGYCDASLSGLGFWFPQSNDGYTSPLPIKRPSEWIYYFEALAVASALTECITIVPSPDCIILYTDNSNTVDMFNTLRVTSPYNLILRYSVDLLITHKWDLRVLHIPGDQNVVADALSRNNLALANSLVPGLTIYDFTPPQDALGEPLS